MLAIVTTGLSRTVGDWVRRADRGLARTAARNAATSLATVDDRRLEDARALHDLRRALGRPATDEAARAAR